MATFQSHRSGNWGTNSTWGQTTDECVANGGFDSDTKWTKPSGASITGGKLVWSNVTSGNESRQEIVDAAFPLGIGRAYSVTFTISGYSAGAVRVDLLGNGSGTQRSANGTYTETITAGTSVSNGNLRFYAVGATTLSIDDVSVTLVSEAQPADNDTVTINEGHAVLMNTNQSAWSNGVNTLTITGSASGTPGKLYFADGSDGFLVIKAGCFIQGTNVANKGQLVANSDGVLATTSPLTSANYAFIQLGTGTTNAVVTGAYLDIALRATHPTIKYATVFHKNVADSGHYFEFDGATGVDPSTDTITLANDPPADGTMVMFRATAGATLPAGLEADVPYYIYSRSAANNTCKLTYQANMAATLVDITADGSGTIAMLVEFGTSQITQTFSVLENISDDPAWVTTAERNRVMLCEVYDNGDRQCGEIAAITPGTHDQVQVTFKNNSGNLDSAQKVAPRLYLVSRNVSVRFMGASGSTNAGINGVNSSTAVLVMDCEMIGLNAFNTTSGSTTNSGYLVYGYSSAVTISGIFAAAYTAIEQCAGAFSFTGIVVGGGYGISNCDGAFSAGGEIFGCNSGGIGGCDGAFAHTGIMGGIAYMMYVNNGSYTTSGSTFYGPGNAACLCGGQWVGTNVRLVLANISNAAGAFRLQATFVGGGNGLSGHTGAFEANVSMKGMSLAVSSNSGPFTMSGAIEKSNYAFRYHYYGMFYLSSMTIHNCATAFGDSRNFHATNLTLSGNTTDFASDTAYFGGRAMARSFLHNGVANMTRMWHRGGTLITQEDHHTAAATYAWEITFSSAAHRLTMEWELMRPSLGIPISITVYAYNKGTSLAASERLKWELACGASDPLVGGTALDTFQSANSNAGDPGNGSDTGWESYTITYTPVDDRPLFLRLSASRASGDAWAYFEMPTSIFAPARASRLTRECASYSDAW